MRHCKTLILENLSCGRDGIVFIKGLRGSLHEGELLVLRGPNGTGKTTLLKTLGGLLRPLGGRVIYDNGRSRGSPHGRDCFHYGSHEGLSSSSLKVREFLEVWLGLLGVLRTFGEQTAALKAVDLGGMDDIYVRWLSEGQSRRLFLTLLYLVRRDIWLLDEPLAALDSQGQKLVENLIDAHLERGGIAVVSTHQRLRTKKVPQRLFVEKGGLRWDL